MGHFGESLVISVVIPLYNREGTIARAIDSVLSQTFSNFEILIVDNGSTDTSREIALKYCKNDSRINYIYQENSGSPAGSRNTGIGNSQYDWVAFLDSDDYWFPKKLESVVNAIEANPSVILISHSENQELNNKFQKTLKNSPKDNSSKSMYEKLFYGGNFLSTSAIVVKKQALIEVGLFDTRKDYYAVEDYDLWMKLSQVGEFFFIHEVLGTYCLDGGNLSSKYEIFFKNLESLLMNHANSNKSPLDFSKEKIKARVLFDYARILQTNGEFRHALLKLIASVKFYPFFPKQWALLAMIILKTKR